FFNIISKATKKVLEVPGFAIDDGIPIQQFTDNGGENQQWEIVHLDLVDQQPVRVVSRSSGKLLGGPDAQPHDHTPVEQFTDDGGNHLIWHMVIKKYGNRWMTEAQIAEAEEQKKADRIWAPRLKQVHKDIHGSNGAKRRDQAQAELDAITDPTAIPSLYREFAGRSETDQSILIQVLGQIDRPLSTEVLAMLSVYGRTPEVRRRAAEILRRRPADDYLGLLVGLLVDPLK